MTRYWVTEETQDFVFHQHKNRRKPANFRVMVKKAVFVDRSRYKPHQGKREIARRVNMIGLE